MTLSSTTSKQTFDGDGAQTAFPTPFVFQVNADVLVVLRKVDGTEVNQVLGTDYELEGALSESGGTVTMNIAPAVGEKLTVKRDPAPTQDARFPLGGEFPSTSAEAAIDRVVMIVQSLIEKIGRSLLLPISSEFSGLELPEPAENKLLGWNAASTALENKTVAELGGSIDTLLTSLGDNDQLRFDLSAKAWTNRPSPVFDAKADYGAKGDGVTDDTTAIQAACTAAAAATHGGIVVLPPGRFATSSPIDPGNNVTIVGAGMGLTVIVQTKDDNRVFNAQTQSRGYVAFRDFTVEGRWNDNQSQGGDDDRHFFITGYRNIVFERVESLYCRQMAITGRATESVRVKNCRVLYCARDAINFSGSGGIAHFVDNEIRHCHDDAIAYHTNSTDGNPPREGIVVTGNQLEDSFGIKVLGARKATINHNVIRRAKGYGIQLGISGTEGENDQIAVDISHNNITDVFNGTIVGGGNVQAGINLSGPEPSDGGGTADAKPGQFDGTNDVWIKESDWWLNTIGLSSAVPKSGSWFVNVSHNIIAQTLDDVTAYSDWELGTVESAGRLFDPDGWADPAVSGHIFSGAGIFIQSAYDQLQIAHNLFYGLQRGIRYESPDRIRRHWIESNKFVRLQQQAVSQSHELRTEDMQVWIRGNFVDIDPLIENSARASSGDGKWDLTVSRMAFDLVGWTGVVVEGNTIKNCVGLYQEDSNTQASVVGNWIVGEFVGRSDADNKGVFSTPDVAGQHYLFVDSDPNSATYDQVLGYPVFSSAAQPSTGSYAQGHFVKNRNPTVDANGNVLMGWLRLTWGSGHVAGTDWETIYWKTNSP